MRLAVLADCQPDIVGKPFGGQGSMTALLKPHIFADLAESGMDMGMSRVWLSEQRGFASPLRFAATPSCDFTVHSRQNTRASILRTSAQGRILETSESREALAMQR